MVFLAGIPKNPSRFDPITKYETAVERRDYILKQLYAKGELSGLEYYAALEEEIVLQTDDQSRYNYVETFVFYCAARSLMKANGFVFQYEFEDDEAKKESIDNISATFCAREELQRKLMENYQRMYEQTLISERKQK